MKKTNNLPILAMVFLLWGCAPTKEMLISQEIHNVRVCGFGRHDLGNYKKGEFTPFKILVDTRGEDYSLYIDTGQNLNYILVFDNGLCFRMNEDWQTQRLAEFPQLFRIEPFMFIFNDDMKMTIYVIRDDKVPLKIK